LIFLTDLTAVLKGGNQKEPEKSPARVYANGEKGEHGKKEVTVKRGIPAGGREGPGGLRGDFVPKVNPARGGRLEKGGGEYSDCLA